MATVTVRAHSGDNRKDGTESWAEARTRMPQGMRWNGMDWDGKGARERRTGLVRWWVGYHAGGGDRCDEWERLARAARLRVRCIVPWGQQYKLVLCLWTVRTHTDTVWRCLSRA